MSDDKSRIKRIGKGGIGISFGIQDATKENFDELERNEVMQLLADRGIGGAELMEKARALYKRAGSPEGPGPEGFVKWLEKL